ncbi:MAG: hypothetical protein H0T46_13875 [Deltaproteobacteria bacterium]|nr:hypothetical protein [Deltaproteobacteria bacterium]
MESGELFARLRAAFPAEALDFEDALTGGTDGGEFREAVAGKNWTELDPVLIGRRSDVLSFLQPEYVVAVLPAFLLTLVGEGTSTGAPDTLLVVLDRDQEPRFDKISARMTEPQRAVVAEALESYAAGTIGGQASAARHAINGWRKKR